jgi:RNA polymerase primary sigma factor
MNDRQLSRADVTRLARRIEQGDQAAKEEMIVRNLGLVRSLATRYSGRGVAFEDLVQEGAIGLMHAVERFDHRRGLQFSTYAVWWIRRSLLDALSAGLTIRIPPVARRRIAEIQRAQDELRTARDTAIARHTGLTARTVRQLRAVPHVAASLDAPVDEDRSELGELIADDGVGDVAELAEDRERRRQVWSMLRLLPQRQRQVLVRRYGLVGDRPQTHPEIGASLGVGEERSRQLEQQALHRLRELGDRVPLAAQRSLRTSAGTPAAGVVAGRPVHPASRHAQPPRRATHVRRPLFAATADPDRSASVIAPDEFASIVIDSITA